MKSFLQYITEAKEYILWGLPKGKKDPLYQEILSTQSKTPAQVEEVKRRAAREGWHSFRVQILDMSEPFEWNAKKMVKEAKVNYWDRSTPRAQWLSSPWQHILGIRASERRDVPLTAKLVNDIWKTPVVATVFHTTNGEGAIFVMKNEGKKGVALSVTPNAPYTTMAQTGIWKGGVVVKLKANILLGGTSDIMSVPDESGRRWVHTQTILNLLPQEHRYNFRSEMDEANLLSSEHLVGMIMPVLEKQKASGVYLENGLLELNYFIKLLTDIKRADSVGENRRRWVQLFSSGSFPLRDMVKKELGVFVKAHIDRVNVILKKYLGYARQEIEELAARTRITSSGYYELVANQYKVLGVAWYNANIWGIGLEELEKAAATAGVPLWNFTEQDRESKRWSLKPDEDLHTTKDYKEYIKK